MDHHDDDGIRYLSAAEMNNRAITFFEGNKNCIATEYLRDALTTLKDDTKADAPIAMLGTVHKNEELNSSKDSSESSSWGGNQESGNHCCSSGPIKRLSVKGTPVPLKPQKEITEPSSKTTQIESFVCIYDRAIFLTPATPPSLSSSLFDQAYMSSVVLYNMALFNHVKGIENGRSSFVLRAMQLYKLSFEIIQARIEQEIDNEEEEEDLDSFGCDQHVTLLLMALFNNMAQVLSLLYRFEEMQQVLEHLSDIIAATFHGETQSPNIEPQEYAVFYMNAMVIHESHLQVAAAA